MFFFIVTMLYNYMYVKKISRNLIMVPWSSRYRDSPVCKKKNQHIQTYWQHHIKLVLLNDDIKSSHASLSYNKLNENCVFVSSFLKSINCSKKYLCWISWTVDSWKTCVAWTSRTLNIKDWRITTLLINFF